MLVRACNVLTFIGWIGLIIGMPWGLAVAVLDGGSDWVAIPIGFASGFFTWLVAICIDYILTSRLPLSPPWRGWSLNK